MNLGEFITFEEFCGMNIVIYREDYNRITMTQKTFRPRKMNDVILETLWNEFCNTALTAINIELDQVYDDETGTQLMLFHDVDSAPLSHTTKKITHFLPNFDMIMNGKYPVIACNFYDAQTGRYKNFSTALITNSYPTLSSMPFKDKVHTVVDIRKVTKEQWDQIFAGKITSVKFSEGVMFIYFKDPFIRIMEAI